MHYLGHGKGSTFMVDDSSTNSRHKGGLIPPQSTPKTGPGHGCFSFTPLSQGSATHKHRRYGNSWHRHNYRRGFGTLRKRRCGTN